jgi:hypothetical protein
VLLLLIDWLLVTAGGKSKRRTPHNACTHPTCVSIGWLPRIYISGVWWWWQAFMTLVNKVVQAHSSASS